MKSIITHLISFSLGVVVTILMMSQCSRKATVVETINTTDTLEIVKYDTIETVRTEFVTKWKTKTDTLTREIKVDSFIYITSDEKLLTYDEYYNDSTYQVSGNITYTGDIKSHDQMFVQLKENKEIVYVDRQITKDTSTTITSTKTRQPRLLVGAYSTLSVQPVNFQQAGVNLTFVDNKHRQYTVGKDVLNKDYWMAGFKVPLFYSKYK